MKKINYSCFIAVFGIISSLILYKILNIPVTHDETATPVHYINFTAWEIMMYPDKWANNHILNTLIVKFLVNIFGISQFIIRFPNLLAFFVYTIAVFRINKIILKPESIWFIPASLLFIAYPYYLDFFSLCRGYGISWALATLSLSYIIEGFQTSTDRYLWTALGLNILASYANFTLLIFTLSTVAIIWSYFYLQYSWKKLFRYSLIMIIIIGLFSALIAKPISVLSSNNQFIYWQTSGIFSQTLISYLILLVFSTFLAILIFIWINKKGKLIELFQRPLFITLCVLLTTAFITVMQCIIMHTPSLRGRIALFFFPLVISTVVSLLGLTYINRNNLTIYISAILISCSCVFNLSYTYSMKYVIQWSFDENTFDVLNYLQSVKQPDKKIILKTDWLFHPSFNFYYYIGQTPWLELKSYDKNLDLKSDIDYYYIFSKDYEFLKIKYEPILKLNDERWLLKRR